MNKKGALSLSVNAIIVFVLAFAMLGVGLTVTNLLSEKVTGGIANLPTDELVIQQPSSTDPITLPQNIDLKRNGQEKLQFGFYNKNPTSALYATVGIVECKFSSDGETGSVEALSLPLVLSTSQDIEASEAAGYLIAIQDQGLTAGTYVCTLVIYDGSGEIYTDAINAYENRNADPTPIYGQEQFFLNIVT
jgi:hypothetical protein